MECFHCPNGKYVTWWEWEAHKKQELREKINLSSSTCEVSIALRRQAGFPEVLSGVWSSACVCLIAVCEQDSEPAFICLAPAFPSWVICTGKSQKDCYSEFCFGQCGSIFSPQLASLYCYYLFVVHTASINSGNSWKKNLIRYIAKEKPGLCDLLNSMRRLLQCKIGC